MLKRDMAAMRRVAESIRVNRSVDGPKPRVRPAKAEVQTGIIYFIGPAEGMVKIGFTTNLPQRLQRLQCGSPVPLYVPASIADQPRTLERDYHREFQSAREHGEWFLRTISINAEIDRIAQRRQSS